MIERKTPEEIKSIAQEMILDLYDEEVAILENIQEMRERLAKTSQKICAIKSLINDNPAYGSPNPIAPPP